MLLNERIVFVLRPFNAILTRSKETWQEANEATSRIAQRSMEQFSKMFGLDGETAREAFQQSSGNLQAVMESTTVIASGLHEVTGEWMRFAQERVEHNLNHLDRPGELPQSP